MLAGAAVLLVGAVLAVIRLSGQPARAPRIDESLPGNTGSPATSLLSPSPPTPRPAAAAGSPPALTVAYATTDSWSGGYTGQLTISTASPLSGWIASLTLPTRAAVTNSWEADYEQRGVAVSLTPKEWNATLPAGGRIQVGFQVDLAPNAPRYPLTCAVNGVPCSAP